MGEPGRAEALRWAWTTFEGHRLRYSTSGRGPALVLPKKDRRDYAPARLLADQYTVIQVEPVGFGRSDRPTPHPSTSVDAQVLAVCDAAGIEQFAVWGFSQGGAMACTVARATRRAQLLVCGGFNVVRGLSDAWLTRMNRERRVAAGSRAFWNDFHRHDWLAELRRLTIPTLIYAGSLDRQRMERRERHAVQALGVDVVELDGLDHARCGLGDPSSPATDVVVDWMHRHGW